MPPSGPIRLHVGESSNSNWEILSGNDLVPLETSNRLSWSLIKGELSQGDVRVLCLCDGILPRIN